MSGNIDARQVAINTRAVLELAGRTDVEVALGREVPLVRPLETTPETHGPQGLGHAELPPPSRPLSERHAVDLIVDEARRRPGEIMLVTLGPLTNLALALQREPALPRLLRGYTLMGGAYGVSGNTTPDDRVEHPLRSRSGQDRVLGLGRRDRGRSDHPATARARARRDGTGEGRTRRRRPARTPRRQPAGRLDRARPRRGPDARDAVRGRATRSCATSPTPCASTWSSTPRYDGFYGAFIHDPLAVAAALDRSLVTTEALFVDVETAGELTAGMTVADRRRLTGKPPNLDVAQTADVGTFLDRLIERVGGLAADHPDVSR